ncbi:DNA polymerase exonuclease subunit [Acidovorax phage ACP17]|uniref:Exonuclease n=1 Tax=Acidovorax phage ACP17 TaxID=2010329 RepID=A0A218M3B5_9CAUD|nr:DNA polymerase exonuclease subunit [Acidovorax phage ACP17]ASD50531.1 exonuclease [Acidovorax phage ACP17]
MKILFLDVETSPNIAHVWGLWQNNVSLNQLMESSHMLCWAAKWAGSKTTEFASIYNSDRVSMLKRIHELLDEADVVVHYNGKRFDMPTLNKEFLLAGYAPPSPYKQIDLFQTVKAKFRFPSNKLDYVSGELGLGKKKQHEGHTLWVKCMAGEAKAWATMKAYNVQDVVLLEKLYKKLLPWIPNHPHRALFSDAHLEHSCPNCGSTHITKKGFSVTAAGRWQRYQCQGCGAWSKGEKILALKDVLKQA